MCLVTDRFHILLLLSRSFVHLNRNESWDQTTLYTPSPWIMTQMISFISSLCLGVWSEAWISVTINVWLYLSNSLTMCVFNSCWPLIIASKMTSEYWARVDHCLGLSTSNSKEFCDLEVRLLLNQQRWHRQMSCVF